MSNLEFGDEVLDCTNESRHSENDRTVNLSETNHYLEREKKDLLFQNTVDRDDFKDFNKKHERENCPLEDLRDTGSSESSPNNLTQVVYSCMEPIIFNRDNINTTVLVTGATGFIASHIVERLLLRGFKVRATTRSKNSENCNTLFNFPFAVENLELLEADLLDNSCWENLVKGCKIVIHCASPYRMDCKDPYEIINPATIGTKNVLHACCMCEDVNTVVLTSSIAAVVGAYKNGKVYSEVDWNDDSDPQLHPYLFSKVEAEKIAFRIIDECRPSLRLIVVNPGMVIGPSYRNDINQSVQWIYDMITGKMRMAIDLQSGWVDVRDVAEIHIRLFESKGASGRFICVEGMYTFLDISRTIKQTLPHLSPPNHLLPSFLARFVLPIFASRNAREFLKMSLGKRILLSNGRILSYFPSYKFLSISESIRDTCSDLSSKFEND
ncbi:cinnamyl-alcohol dehydrogenase-like nucleoside diphosphate sugar epimerase [Cryptosporidium felis]|nr:cinnamyl-alcohol dehydrogenase-like nucleoside diphosphate sugar epimerase [Cryptosporidium felis]